MSQRDGFGGGFVLGAIVGGAVGGLLGAVLASRRNSDTSREQQSLLKSNQDVELRTEESIEVARRSLEEKIAQLNLAIDDVRQQLDPVNGNVSEN
jgi:tetrahydromethanopterin S-methyltransferase subunit B